MSAKNLSSDLCFHTEGNRFEEISSQLITAHQAAGSRRVYRAGIRRFSDFCLNVLYSQLPASVQMIRHFLSHLFQRRLSYPTVKVYLSSINSYHVLKGFAKPLLGDQSISSLLLGYRKTIHAPQNRRKPITIQILRRLKYLLPHSKFVSLDKLMLWNGFSLAFFAFYVDLNIPTKPKLIFSNCNLSSGDLLSDGHTLTVTLKTSKCSQISAVTILVESTNNSCCAVRAFDAYAMRHCSRYNRQSPVFVFAYSTLLTRHRLNRILFTFLGPGFSSHGFRIGAATTAVEAGLDEVHIKTLKCGFATVLAGHH